MIHFVFHRLKRFRVVLPNAVQARYLQVAKHPHIPTVIAVHMNHRVRIMDTSTSGNIRDRASFE